MRKRNNSCKQKRQFVYLLSSSNTLKHIYESNFLKLLSDGSVLISPGICSLFHSFSPR